MKGSRVRYLLSMPERLVRAAAASVGGMLYETSLVILPEWLRRSRLYQAVVARFLRITVEWVGGVQGALPADEVDAKTLAVRKAAGNVIEVASFLAVGWSPLWLLAAAADLTGGTQTYLRTLVAELKRDGLLPNEADISSAKELLDNLEATTGAMADIVDVPPLNVADMRRSWRALKNNLSELPDADRLASLYEQLRQVARQEGRTLRSVSGVIAASAMRAGIQLGHSYLFDFYRISLGSIKQEGLAAYTRRVSKPYLAAAAGHFDASRTTGTDRLLARTRRKRDT